MRRRMMKSKIHRATVTEADLNYIGSISLDPDLMAAADILHIAMIRPGTTVHEDRAAVGADDNAIEHMVESRPAAGICVRLG